MHEKQLEQMENEKSAFIAQQNAVSNDFGCCGQSRAQNCRIEVPVELKPSIESSFDTQTTMRLWTRPNWILTVSVFFKDLGKGFKKRSRRKNLKKITKKSLKNISKG